MKHIFSILFFTLCILAGCSDSNTKTASEKTDTSKTSLNESEMIGHIKKAINPEFKNWVVFSNGTYIILDDSAITDIRQKAIDIMKEHGPVHPGTAAGDITIVKLTLTEGWAVAGDYSGMYTYVHPNEISAAKPSDLKIGFWGRKKRNKDSKDLKVIYINE